MIGLRQPPMRQWERIFRERGRTLAAVLWQHRLTVAAYVFGGALMAHVGAFGTHSFSAGVRFPYFIGLNIAGALFAVAATEALHRGAWLAKRPLAEIAAQAAAVTVLMTPLVWIAAASFLNGDSDPLRMLTLLRQVAPAVALFTPITLLSRPVPLTRSSEPANETNSDDAPSLLRSALPAGLRMAAIYAVEGQDHYLRVHTDAGSALVAMRLSEAIASLPAAEGARTHRSWWVARDAILTAKRKRGRAMLSLCNGLTVPVSRTYARSLREAGWL